MTMKAKYLDWDIEIFSQDEKFYSIASKKDVCVMSNYQTSVEKALEDIQLMIRRVWHV